MDVGRIVRNVSRYLESTTPSSDTGDSVLPDHE